MMDAKSFVASLSDEQRLAATHTHSPVMALAGAGSGKTRMLVGRFLHLVSPESEGGLGADPSSVMMVTFTNKAAREMRERVMPALDILKDRDPNRRIAEPWIGTFHGLSLRILRIEADRAGLGKNFSIFDESDSRSLLNDVTEEMGLEQFDADEFFRDLETAKARILTPDYLSRGQEMIKSGGPMAGRWSKIMAHFKSDGFVDVYARYQSALEEQNAVDFSDLLNRTTQLLRSEPEVRDSWKSTFRHFMVDEVQDINRAQVAWLREITGGGEVMEIPEAGNTSEYGEASDGMHEINTYRLRKFPRPTIAFVGDDDQSIYAFRGSEVAVMRSLPDRFPGLETRFMGTSYRCQPSILEAANSLVGRNTGRFGKDLTPHEGSARTGKVRYRKLREVSDEIREIAKEAESFLADGGDANEFAVLVRTRDIVKQISKDLRSRGLPVVEGRSSDIRKTMEVKDVMSFVTFLTNPDAETALRRVINKPSRGMGLTSMRRVISNARLKNCSFMDELKSIMNGRIDIPNGGEGYPKRFVSSVEEFGSMINQTRKDVSSAANASDAIFIVMKNTGYLDDLYKSALKSAGLSKREEETRDMDPRSFLSWIIANGSDRNFKDGPEAEQKRLFELDGEDLADRAGALSEVARRIGNLSLLMSEAAPFEALESFSQESVLEMGNVTAPAGIQIMTVHAAKGLEFDHVRLPFWIEGVMPHGRAVEEGGEAIEEERRLAYVALTRARLTVGVSSPLSVRNCPFIRQNASDQSRFVDEMAASGSVHFVRMKDTPKALYLDAGKPGEKVRAPVVSPARASSPSKSGPHMPEKDYGTPLSESEMFHPEDPGPSLDDLMGYPDPGYDVDPEHPSMMPDYDPERGDPRDYDQEIPF